MKKTTKYYSYLYMTPLRNKHHQLAVEEEHAAYLAAITIVDNCKEVAETMPNAMESISSDHESRECMEPVAENLQEQLQLLQKKHDTLQEKHMTHCRRYIGSDHDFRFYTSFPNYSTFKVFKLIVSSKPFHKQES